MKDICVQKQDGPRILVIRGQKVILDQDLALLYRVTTVSLNQAVRRNPTRFPNRFVLVVTRKEVAILISQNVISKIGRGGATKPPMAFTEHGALQDLYKKLLPLLQVEPDSKKRAIYFGV